MTSKNMKYDDPRLQEAYLRGRKDVAQYLVAALNVAFQGILIEEGCSQDEALAELDNAMALLRAIPNAWAQMGDRAKELGDEAKVRMAVESVRPKKQES